LYYLLQDFLVMRSALPIKTLIAGVMVASLATSIQTVQAEGVLLAGQPEDNAEISNFDGKISLSFSGNVSTRWPSLLVVNNSGLRVDNKDVALEIGPRSKLTATTGKLTPGPYVIRYRVVTEDGLIVSGIRRFTIKN
jgi:copper resistance protein C